VSLSYVDVGFKACLGFSWHPSGDETFILDTLAHVVGRHDILRELVADVFGEDPFADLRLMQLCWVSTVGQILSAVPPEASTAFAMERDAAISEAFGASQGLPVDTTTSTHSLPIVSGGAGFPSLFLTALASYLGAFYRFTGPLIYRLAQMGGTTTARAATLLEDPLATIEGQG